MVLCLPHLGSNLIFCIEIALIKFFIAVSRFKKYSYPFRGILVYKVNSIVQVAEYSKIIFQLSINLITLQLKKKEILYPRVR